MLTVRGVPTLAGVMGLTILAAVAPAAVPAAARAEQPLVTSQAEAANARFLAFTPPPPGGAAAICLVDTGLDLNPDTQPNVVERIAVDGGDPGDVYPSRHGTQMAMVAGGAVNGWGSVGIWPSVRIVSVRAAAPGETGFPFAYYKQATRRCRERAPTTGAKVINLSLGGSGATEDEIGELRNVFVQAHANGLNVVAAAGNSGGHVEYPAAIPDALAVGAGDEAGALCAFSSRGAALDLVAPGCGLDVGLPDGRPAIGGGTSAAAALTAAVVAALRSYRPDLGPADAERLITSQGRPGPAGTQLDAEAAFRAAGLGPVVDAGHAALPSGGPATPRAELPRTGPDSGRLPRPRLRRAVLRGSRLTLRLANRPPGALVVARIAYRAGRGEFRRRERTVERAASTLRLRPPGSWTRMRLEYRSVELAPSASLPLTRRSMKLERSNNRRAR